MCKSCAQEVLSAWRFCPNCGFNLKKESASNLVQEPKNSRELPDRFKLLIQDYEKLTGTKLEKVVIQEFLKHAAVPKLSVIDRDRRVKSGKQVRQTLRKGLFSLDLDTWLERIYDNPEISSGTRVWMTTKGDKYHLDRECRGLRDGQNYARFFGKETYNPQYVEIRDAAHIWGKLPCLVCNPPKFIKKSEKTNRR
jgi:hypothetical protein